MLLAHIYQWNQHTTTYRWFDCILRTNSTKDKALADLRFAQGSTIASGLVAGGAIGSLFSAVLRIVGVDVFAEAWVETPEATYLSIVMYLLLCVFLYKVAMYVKAKKA